jgi:GR25 family glycosyltransferase involved in LPS biosynthesis
MDLSEIQNNYPAFIIHVPELCSERSESCLKNVKNAGYKNAIIFNGVNGTNENEVNEALKLFNYPKFDSWIKGGGLGCNLSMLKVLLKIVQDKIPIATIFEDDVIFHPSWEKMSSGFYTNTPKNFDIIYMGNQIDECRTKNNVPRINKKSCFCMHATIVSNKGARKMLQLILSWNYKSQNVTKFTGRILNGLTNCDVILKYYQHKILNKEINKNIFIWYCWNGTINQCNYNKLPLNDYKRWRNSGMVFQNNNFESTSNLK